MIRAASRGVLGLGERDPQSPRFWTRFGLIAEALEDEAELTVLGFDHQRKLAYLPRIKSDSLDDLVDRIDAGSQRLRAVLFPYLEQADARTEAAGLADLWVQQFGDPNDPAVKAEIDKLVRYFNGESG